MTLSTRIGIAMVFVTLVACTGVGALIYFRLEASLRPALLEQLSLQSEQLANDVHAVVDATEADVHAVLATRPLQGLARAGQEGGQDPVDGTPFEQWKSRLEAIFVGHLTAKRHYGQFRVIGVSDGGRELVRVDRYGPAGAIRVVPAEALQSKGGRTYFQEAIALAAGQTGLSSVELNREHNMISMPHVPVLRVSTPVIREDGTLFAVVVINLDLNQAFNRIRSNPGDPRENFAVNPSGDYLMHPERSREFGFEFGQPHRIEDDFPTYDGAIALDGTILSNTAGRRFALAASPVVRAGHPLMTIVRTVPYETLMAPLAEVRRSTFLVGLAAVIGAAALAYVVGRSLARSLHRIATQIRDFDPGVPLVVPGHAPKEIGVLCDAFRRMSAQVQARTAALETEIEVRKKTEASLNSYIEQVRLYSAVVESSEDAIITKTLDGIITGWNPAAERLYGYTAREAIGQSIQLIVPEDRTGEIDEILARIRAGESIKYDETIRRHKTGRMIDVSLSVSHVRDSERQIVGASVIARDITERKLANEAILRYNEELARSNQELETFAYVASHDLQEPLRMVASYVELLANRYQGKLDEKADKYIFYAVDGAKRMKQLINDLLAYSRISTTGRPIAATDTLAVVKQVVRSLDVLIQEHGAKVTWGELPPVLADATQLAQLFQNIIGNGIKFHGEAPPHVHIEATRNGEFCEFSIEDNGIGIDEKYAERVFQMFQRLHAREAYDGTGIGLAVAKKIVERHGGTIRFESSPGMGTRFYFTIPSR